MEIKGKLEGIQQDLPSNRVTFTISCEAGSAAEELERLQDKELRVKITQFRKKRSLSANALFWACVGQIALATGADSWSIYLKLLRDYGKFTYLLVKPEMVESVQEYWRESQVWNSLDINGETAVQMLVYFGSSSYNTQEMSHLIDGAISDMKDLGLDLPMPQDVQVALEQWTIEHGEKQ